MTSHMWERSVHLTSTILQVADVAQLVILCSIVAHSYASPLSNINTFTVNLLLQKNSYRAVNMYTIVVSSEKCNTLVQACMAK